MKINPYLLIFLSVIFVAIACNKKDERPVQKQTTLDHYEQICIRGVTYVGRGNSLSVMLNTDSKIVPCTEKHNEQN